MSELCGGPFEVAGIYFFFVRDDVMTAPQ